MWIWIKKVEFKMWYKDSMCIEKPKKNTMNKIFLNNKNNTYFARPLLAQSH